MILWVLKLVKVLLNVVLLPRPLLRRVDASTRAVIDFHLVAVCGRASYSTVCTSLGSENKGVLLRAVTIGCRFQGLIKTHRILRG